MDVILSYLDNMFLSMPKTPEVQRAKEELLSMMEDKYNELIAEGKKENEAIGIVISEFGDISELMEELGCKNAGSGNTAYGAGAQTAADGAGAGESAYGAETAADRAGAQTAADRSGAGESAYGAETAADGAGRAAVKEKPVHAMSRAEAEEYMETAKKSGKWNAAGTVLCILCAIPLLICGALEDSVNGYSAWMYSETVIVLFGVAPLFVLIGIAIACFIHSGTMMHRFGYVGSEQIQLDASYEKELCERADEERKRGEKMRIISVFLFALCLIPLFFADAISDDDIVGVLGLCLTLIFVAAGVALGIIRRNRRNCMGVLLGEETDEEENEKERGPVGIVLDAILSGYWYIITAVYLGWSFITRDWGFTWIVWVIAWPLYAAISAVGNAIDRD